MANGHVWPFNIFCPKSASFEWRVLIHLFRRKNILSNVFGSFQLKLKVMIFAKNDEKRIQITKKIYHVRSAGKTNFPFTSDSILLLNSNESSNKNRFRLKQTTFFGIFFSLNATSMFLFDSRGEKPTEARLIKKLMLL